MNIPCPNLHWSSPKPILSSMKIRWSAARIPASTSPDTPAAIGTLRQLDRGRSLLEWQILKKGWCWCSLKNRCHFLNGGESEDVLKIYQLSQEFFDIRGLCTSPFPWGTRSMEEATMEMSPVSRGDIKRHLRRGRIGIRNGAFTKKRWDMAYGSTPIIAIFGGRTMKNRPLSSCFRVPSGCQGFDPQKHPGHPNGDADANGWICGGDCFFAAVI